MVAGLRERHLAFTNSVILHELYFGNLGGSGTADGAIRKALADAFGSVGRFEELFRATGLSLAGGSGWAILDFGFHTGDLRIHWSGDHTQALASGQPLLVMDMYEHAYHIDYGAAAARYIDAFFQNIRWEEVDRRYELARNAARAMRT
jgi:Fe-Mn family superoxide dismutase